MCGGRRRRGQGKTWGGGREGGEEGRPWALVRACSAYIKAYDRTADEAIRHKGGRKGMCDTLKLGHAVSATTTTPMQEEGGEGGRDGGVGALCWVKPGTLLSMHLLSIRNERES